MKIRYAFAVGLVAASLAGCQTIDAIQGFAVTQSQLDTARSTYDGTALVALDKYAQLKRCPKGVSFTLAAPCHESVALKKLRAADKTVEVAFSDTQNQITSGNTSGASAAWKSLQTAINVVQGLVNATGASSL